jgi:hypothetical protein
MERPALVHLNLGNSAPLKKDGEQRARWPGADDAYHRHHARSASDNAPAAAATSLNEL